MSRSFITLTTDFGIGDHEAGVLKGVIWRIAPQAKIADLSHDISPQDVIGGALLLARCTSYFPAGTIHVAVVDPGVGTGRRGLAARIGDHYFVGPDNGLFTLLLKKAEANQQLVECVSLENPHYWLDEVSNVFHGRDVFAPVAAHLANHVSLDELGSIVKDPVRLNFPEPVRTHQGWKSQIIHIDYFGNLGTNIRIEHLAGNKDIRVRVAGQEIRGLVKTFGERPVGELVALIDSNDTLAISVVNGSAAARLEAHIGDPVELIVNSF